MANFADLVNLLIDLIKQLIPLVFALTLIVVIWGIVQAWIINAGDDSAVERGKHIALAGVIALVVMSGIWGILLILSSSLFPG